PLHRAAEGGHKALIKHLLDAGVDLEARGWYQWTSLHYAVRCPLSASSIALQHFLAVGAFLEACDEDQRTPLHIAAARLGKNERMQQLLAAGADVQARDKDGWTPLHHAACHAEEANVQRLLKANANPNA
ncbi:unnamed protein product, partial [Heterosigma akashiwo]